MRTPTSTSQQRERWTREAASPDGNELPVLWHLKVSNYNEKARWALDYKGVPHVRRAAIPGRHPEIARRLTGGRTFPVLVAEDDAIGDSTAIIAALEHRYPDPPLYPADPVARRDALDVEDYLDEELGPHIRLLVLHHLLADGGLMLGAFVPDLAGARRLAALAMFPQVKRRVISDFGITDHSVRLAFAKVRAAGDRFADQLRAGAYLVADRFTVADLTLAALAAPAVAPEQFPYPQPQRGHPLLAPLREAMSEFGLLEWTQAMYARHRGVSSEVQAGARHGG
jgi:glutathione S-transferase